MVGMNIPKHEQRILNALLLGRYVWTVVAVLVAAKALGVFALIVFALGVIGIEGGCLYFGRRVISRQTKQTQEFAVYAMGRVMAEGAIRQIEKDRDEIREKVAMRQTKGEVRH